MRLRVLALIAVAVVATAGPALAQQGGGKGPRNGSRSSAEGSWVSSGNSSTSARIKQSGPVNIGVIQGRVVEGGSQVTTRGVPGGAKASSSGDQVDGAVTSREPNAVSEGVVTDSDVPAMEVADESESAARTGPEFLIWAVAGLIVAGLGLLYWRLPRAVKA